MKYQIKIALKDNQFKMDYRRTIISFFKKAISSYMGGEFYQDLYENGTYQKSLVWAIKFKKPKFEGETIFLEEGSFELTLKINDAETALIYYSSLLEMKGVAFPLEKGNTMTLESIRMVREKVIAEEIAVFKILSPICLKIHDSSNKDNYLSVEDEDFSIELLKKLLEDYPAQQAKVKALQFNFEGLKKIIIRAYGMKIPVTIGTLVIQGDTGLLNEILKKGLGSKRNSGFGLVDVLIP